MGYVLITFLVFAIGDPSHFRYIFVVASPFLAWSMWRASATRARLDRTVMLALFAILSTGGIVVAYDAAIFGVLDGAGFWLAGPAIWTCIALVLSLRHDAHHIIHRSIVIASWLAALVNLSFIICVVLGFAYRFSWVVVAGYSGIDDRGFFAYSTSFLPQIGYFIPYFSLRFIAARHEMPRSEHALLALLVFVGALSLRLSIVLTALPCVLACAYSAFRRRRMLLILAAILVCALAAIVAFYLGDSDVIRGIYDLKLAGKIGSEDPRFKQVLFWFERFLDAPLLGNGISSTDVVLIDLVTGEITQKYGTISNPYGYEVLFFRLLSEIGLLLIPLITAYVFACTRSYARSKLIWQVSALRLSLLALLLQSQTNTYLSTSGWLFVLFFPIVFSLRRPQRSQSPSRPIFDKAQPMSMR